jgi:hypothetical protein
MQDKTKKIKKQGRVRDLKPKKDAKGGMRKAGGDHGPASIQGPRPNTLNFT